MGWGKGGKCNGEDLLPYMMIKYVFWITVCRWK